MASSVSMVRKLLQISRTKAVERAEVALRGMHILFGDSPSYGLRIASNTYPLTTKTAEQILVFLREKGDCVKSLIIQQEQLPAFFLKGLCAILNNHLRKQLLALDTFSLLPGTAEQFQLSVPRLFANALSRQKFISSKREIDALMQLCASTTENMKAKLKHLNNLDFRAAGYAVHFQREQDNTEPLPCYLAGEHGRDEGVEPPPDYGAVAFRSTSTPTNTNL